MKLNCVNIFWLGVIHNCQHLPISTESTNLGGGRAPWAKLAYYFLNVDLFVEHTIKINACKMYYMVLNTTVHTAHGQVICIVACHAPIMDNPENNQHFNVLIYVGGRGV